MRIGEMESHAVTAHGVSLFLQESMMKRSDATNFWVCNGCGTIPIYNEKEKLFVCPMCDGPVEFSGTTAETMTLIQPLKRSRVTFSKVEMPYAFKLFDQEVTTYTGSGLRFITEKSVGRLRDSVLNWNINDANVSDSEGEAQEGEPQKGGVFTPPHPQRYIDELKKEMVMHPISTHFPTKEELKHMPEGGVFKEEHGRALAGGSAPYPDTVSDIDPLTIGQEKGQYSMGSVISPLMGGALEGAPYKNHEAELTPISQVRYLHEYSIGESGSPSQKGGNLEGAPYVKPETELTPISQVRYLHEYSIGESGSPSQKGGNLEGAPYKADITVPHLTEVEYLRDYTGLKGGQAPTDYVGCAPAVVDTYGDGVSNKGQQAPLFFDSAVPKVSDKPDAAISPPVEGPNFKQRADTVAHKGGSYSPAPVNHVDFAASPLIRSDQTDGYTHRGQLATVNFIDPISKFTGPMQGGGKLNGAPLGQNLKTNLPPLFPELGYNLQSGGNAPVNYIDPTPELPKSAYNKQVGGQAPVDTIGVPQIPIVKWLDEAPKQAGGGTLNPAPVNSIGKDTVPVKHNIEEVWAQPQQWQKGMPQEEPQITFPPVKGGALNPAPVNSIGRNTVPLKHNLEEVWAAPKMWQTDMPQEEPQVTFQPIKGGSYTLASAAEHSAPIADTLGSEINQGTFSMPAMGKEPYVVANPYVSPMMFPKEIASVVPNQGNPIQTSAVQLQPVSTQLTSEVMKSVQQGGSRAKTPPKNKNVVFENSEIRVVKLQ